MMSKYLEKKIELLTEDESSNKRSPIKLEYYLLENDNAESDDFHSEKVYGIEIVKIINEKMVESGIVKNLSNCKKSTEFILNKLVNNSVTPVGMPFVLDDMIGV